jgi:hypothetical protein
MNKSKEVFKWRVQWKCRFKVDFERDTGMNEELKEKILKDLMKSGFPFEAGIARGFANLSIDEGWSN